MSSCAAISDGLEPGDVVLGDRGFRSYAHLAILVARAPPGRRAGVRQPGGPAGLAMGAGAGRVGSDRHLAQARDE